MRKRDKMKKTKKIEIRLDHNTPHSTKFIHYFNKLSMQLIKSIFTTRWNLRDHGVKYTNTHHAHTHTKQNFEQMIMIALIMMMMMNIENVLMNERLTDGLTDGFGVG